MVLRSPGLTGWLAIVTVVIVTVAVTAVSVAAIGSLERLAETEAATRVELAVAAAREGVRQSTEDLRTAARILAERPTLQNLLLDGDVASVAPYLERYCDAAVLDGCAVVRGSTVIAVTGDGAHWPGRATMARAQGDRFLLPGTAGRPPWGGASAAVPGVAAASVVVLLSMDAEFVARLSEGAGSAIRLAGLANGWADTPAEGTFSADLVLTTTTGEPVGSIRAELPAAEVMLPVRQLTVRLIGVAVAVALLAAVAGILVGRYWIGGVARLTAAARRIGTGDLSRPVPAERGRELGILATTMEKVRTNLLELEAARRTRDTVLANISHEFRTPLAAQLASIELLHDGLGTMPVDGQRELVESLERGAQRLTRLIDNLLESVRIESGQLAIRRQDVDLDDVFAAARDLIEPLIRQRGQRIETALPDDLPRIRGDRQRLIQVVVNLLANASKFGPADSTISIGGARQRDGIEFWVEDEGSGPPDAGDPVLFEQFRRARGGDPEESGLGLGLFIVRSIVERHGGRVSLARTEVGRTRASITLPEQAGP